MEELGEKGELSLSLLMSGCHNPLVLLGPLPPPSEVYSSGVKEHWVRKILVKGGDDHTRKKSD